MTQLKANRVCAPVAFCVLLTLAGGTAACAVTSASPVNASDEAAVAEQASETMSMAGQRMRVEGFEPMADSCAATVVAKIVALDQPIVLNRPGASIPGGMIFALAGDVFPKGTAPADESYDNSCANLLPLNSAATEHCQGGAVQLRSTQRPRPLVLRANERECIEIQFANLLNYSKLCFDAEGARVPCSESERGALYQPNTRMAGLHIEGVNWVRSALDDGSFVGRNDSSLVAPTSVAPPGEAITYHLFAEHQGPFFLYSAADNWSSIPRGGGGDGGQIQEGLFGALHVQPSGYENFDTASRMAGMASVDLEKTYLWEAEWYRSQVTEQDLCLATEGHSWTDGRCTVPAGSPVIKYDSVYPEGHPQAGMPILAMERCTSGGSLQNCAKSELVHSDLTAVITGPDAGRFPDPDDLGLLPPDLRPNYSYSEPDVDGAYSGTTDDRLDPYREFTIIYHESYQTAQAFPYYFAAPQGSDPFVAGNIGTTANNAKNSALTSLGAASDAFGINYGFGGLAATVLANRLGVGPAAECVDCKYEEFFLTSWANGDPAMVVDNPSTTCIAPDGRRVPCAAATKTFFPDDPSNVYHSYMGDHVRFRILHAGPDLHHLHHQHAHQWLGSPNSPDADYLDSQSIGPASAFTLDMVYHGSGNVNQTVGDSIFHCHFYPHFASGMWSLWRVHDVLETGTELDESGIPCTDESGVCSGPARALPDNEIRAGTPIPALLPMPTLALAPEPAPVRIAQDGEFAGRSIEVKLSGSWVSALYAGNATWQNFREATENGGNLNPGYPFFIAGIAGSRPPHPPGDIAYACSDNGRVCQPGLWGGTRDLSACQDPATASCDPLDGGLPRHVIEEGTPEWIEALSIAGGTTVGDYCTCTAPISAACTTYCELQPYAISDFHKTIESATAIELPEAGTLVEQVAMGAHAVRHYDTLTPEGNAPARKYTLNGLPPQHGAPFADPCIQYRVEGGPATGVGALPNRYMAVDLQIDAIFNKAGWHFPQQRVLSLWGDAFDTLNGTRAPEPLFMRVNSWDCMEYIQANLVPNVYELDDFQVRTPTDILGQHIHLVKFDVTSSDGAANGFNYEDGTFAPNEVTERIHAFNRGGGLKLTDGSTNKNLEAEAIPFFGEGPNKQWLGATATVQRWYNDPLLNNEGVCTNDPELSAKCRISDVSNCAGNFPGTPLCDPTGGSCSDNLAGCTATDRKNCGNPDTSTCLPHTDRTVRTVFTHDHFGPSTHQQAGLYAGVVAEPKGSWWKTNAPSVANNGDEIPAGAVMGGYDARIQQNKWCTDIDTDPFATQNCAMGSTGLNGRRWAEFSGDGGSGKIPATDIRVRDGGPTSWQSLITLPPPPMMTDKYASMREQMEDDFSYREFMLEFQDSTLMYQPFSIPAFDPSDEKWFAQVRGETNECPGEPCGFCSYTGRCQLRPDKKCMVGAPLNQGAGSGCAADEGQCVMGYQTLTACAPANEVDGGMDACVTHGTGKEALESCNFVAGIPSTSWAGSTVGGLAMGARSLVEGVTFDAATNSFSVNYRNEPLFLRTTDPFLGSPVAGQGGDMGWVYASLDETDRPSQAGYRCSAGASQAGPTTPCKGPSDTTTCGSGQECQQVGFCDDNNAICTMAGSKPGNQLLCYNRDNATCTDAPYSPQPGEETGDPFTPLLRAYAGDDIQIRTLVGAHINPHNFTIHGMNWLREPSFLDSGWRNSFVMGISEHFEMLMQVPPSFSKDPVDYLYKPGAAAIEQASGNWGLLRAYTGEMPDLPELPQNTRHPSDLPSCPGDIDRTYEVVAVTSTIVYNERHGSSQNNGMIFLTAADAANLCPAGDGACALTDGDVEPLVLRANSGDCIQVTLNNRIDDQKIGTGATGGGLAPSGSGTTPTSNTSLEVGLHPQLVTYDPLTGEGGNVGRNWMAAGSTPQTVAPLGDAVTYTWYAGHIDTELTEADCTEGGGTHREDASMESSACYIPVEFGAANLLPPDPLNHHRFGLFAGLIIEPKGSSWSPEVGTASVITREDGSTFREFVAFFQDEAAATNISNAMNLRSEPLTVRSNNRSCEFKLPDGTDYDGVYVSCFPSNSAYCPGDTRCGDPVTPVFTATAGEEVRFRFLHPGGLNTNNTIEIAGHSFLDAPYTTVGDNCFFTRNLEHMNPFASSIISEQNLCGSADWLSGPIQLDKLWTESLNEWKGSRMGHGPTNHFDAVIAKAGGHNEICGDYLVRSASAFHFDLGIWGIFRVEPKDGSACPYSQAMAESEEGSGAP